MAVVIKKKELVAITDVTVTEVATGKVTKVPSDPDLLKAYRALHFQKWYQSKGREAHSERRKKRYHEDAEYREQVLARNREVKEKIRVPLDGRIVRYIEGHKELVYRIGQVSEKIGKSPAIIRDWEKLGLIPAPSVTEARRIYTEIQVGLMKSLADALNEAKGDSLLTAEVKENLRPIIYSRWNSKEE